MPFSLSAFPHKRAMCPVSHSWQVARFSPELDMQRLRRVHLPASNQRIQKVNKGRVDDFLRWLEACRVGQLFWGLAYEFIHVPDPKGTLDSVLSARG